MRSSTHQGTDAGGLLKEQQLATSPPLLSSVSFESRRAASESKCKTGKKPSLSLPAPAPAVASVLPACLYRHVAAPPLHVNASVCYSYPRPYAPHRPIGVSQIGDPVRSRFEKTDGSAQTFSRSGSAILAVVTSTVPREIPDVKSSKGPHCILPHCGD
ncbi:hypothetical protein VUR80DRAFT_258 [Thermomyces stellatus]